MMKRYLILIMACVGLFTACVDALDMNPENSITFKNALETENDMEAAVGNVVRGVRDIDYSAAYWNEEMGFYADHVTGTI